MRNLEKVRMPKIGRWVRFLRDDEEIVGRVISHDVDAQTATVDTGDVFNYAAGDRLDFYGSLPPDGKSHADVVYTVMRPRVEGFQAFLIWYASTVSTAALASAVWLLLK